MSDCGSQALDVGVSRCELYANKATRCTSGSEDGRDHVIGGTLLLHLMKENLIQNASSSAHYCRRNAY